MPEDCRSPAPYWYALHLSVGWNRSTGSVAATSPRSPFLLRGLIKSGLCGLTFSGMRASVRQPDHYYCCNGRQFTRGLYGLTGKKCPAKSANGRYIEPVVWADIETFLRNPGEILEKLRERLATKRDDEQLQETKLQQIREQYEQKAEERERMLCLFRRGRIDTDTLDQYLDAIDTEAAELKRKIVEALVESIRADTVEYWGVQQSKASTNPAF